MRPFTLPKMQITLLIIILFVFNFLFGQDVNYSDCKSTMTVCTREFIISSLENYGDDLDNLGKSPCLKNNNKETNSVWLNFKISKSGSFAFTLLPLSTNDDIDFIIYKNVSSCDKLESVRCMASGKNLGTYYNNSEACEGKTGLRNESKDISESSGCYGNADNFLSAFDVQEGESYIVFINNYKSANGFKFEFTGTAEYVPSFPKYNIKNHFNEGLFSFDFSHESLQGLGGSSITWQIEDEEGVQTFRGENIQYVKLNYPGKKKVTRTITNVLGCSTSESDNIEFRSLTNQNKGNGLLISDIYPNPTRNNIYMELIANTKQLLELFITSTEGKTVSTIDKFELDKYKLLSKNIETLAAGTYFANIIDVRTGKKIDSKKFVVSR